MTTEMKYYSLKPLLSRGYPISFVIGERGAGKTYAWKEWAYKTWIASGSEWAYIRRIPDEIRAIKNTLWNDVLSNYGDRHQVRTVGDLCEIRPTPPEFVDSTEKKDWEAVHPWKTFGYYFTIAEGQKYKSSSFPHIDKACFDELIIENPSHRYIGKNDMEPDMYIGLLDSIFRRRTGWHAVALSNAGAIANPYFRKYNVDPKQFETREFIPAGPDFPKVIFQYYYEPENEEYNKTSIIGGAATKTYANYALSNKFRDGGEEFITPKPYEAVPICKFTKDGIDWVTAYAAEDSDQWWLASTNPKVQGGVYSLDPRKPIVNTIYEPEVIKHIKRMYNRRMLTFAKADVREKILDWLDI